MTGPSPVDHGKSGSKLHVLSDRAGISLTVAISAANTNDAEALRPLARAIPAVRSPRGPRRRRPAKLHADKAYDHIELRRLVRDGRATPTRWLHRHTAVPRRILFSNSSAQVSSVWCCPGRCTSMARTAIHRHASYSCASEYSGQKLSPDA